MPLFLLPENTAGRVTDRNPNIHCPGGRVGWSVAAISFQKEMFRVNGGGKQSELQSPSNAISQSGRRGAMAVAPPTPINFAGLGCGFRPG